VFGHDRKAYVQGLSRQARLLRSDLLWCNGLVPGVATSFGAGRRVLHLHQVPKGSHHLARWLSSARAEATVVPSHFLARHVRGSRVLENWTEPADLVSPRSRPDGTTLVVGYLGRLSSGKGVGVLADALRILQARRPSDPLRLVLAGDDRFVRSADSVLVSTKLAGLTGVSRLGWVDRSAFFDQVDLVVVPSTWPESFGLVAAEAMARGLPLVVSNAGALPEVVGSDYPWISRRDDPADLANTIQLVAASPQRVAAVRDGCRKRWLNEFSPDAGYQRFSDLLRELAISTSFRAH
jgi:glycosyltransferase involved in cell wall biosynthesis